MVALSVSQLFLEPRCQFICAAPEALTKGKAVFWLQGLSGIKGRLETSQGRAPERITSFLPKPLLAPWGGHFGHAAAFILSTSSQQMVGSLVFQATSLNSSAYQLPVTLYVHQTPKILLLSSHMLAVAIEHLQDLLELLMAVGFLCFDAVLEAAKIRIPIQCESQRFQGRLGRTV